MLKVAGNYDLQEELKELRQVHLRSQTSEKL